MVFDQFEGLSYNQPKFDASTVWNSNGITITDSNTVGTQPFGIFINRNNTIYIPGRTTNGIYIWENDSINFTKKINTNQFTQFSIFVTSNGDIYTTSVNSPWTINRWLSNETNTSAAIAYSDENSVCIFVDINNTLPILIYMLPIGGIIVFNYFDKDNRMQSQLWIIEF